MADFTVKSNHSGKKFDKAEDVSDLVEQIRLNEDQIATLQLDGNSYGIEPLKEIGQSLQTCHNLRHLFLNDMFTSRLKDEIPKALRYLFLGVQSSRAEIITLNLNDNAIGPVTMPELLPFLRSEQSMSLRHLYLNNCGLGIKGGTMLSTVLSGLENLAELVIGRNRLEIDGIIEISSALSKLTTLERLELPQNGTKEEGIIHLCEALKQNPNLKILNLNDNVLTTTADSLASALKTLNKLEVLNLGDCLLKTKGAIIVLSALESLYRDKWCSRIREINISGNEIGPDAKDMIITTVETILETRENDQMKFTLDLSANNFGSETVDELKNHFGSIIDLIIDDDQGSEDEHEQTNDYDDDSYKLEESNRSIDNKVTTNDELDENLLDNPEALQEHLDTKYNDLESLCRRFFLVSTNGFNKTEKSLNKHATVEIDALIKVGQKKFLKNESDFNLLNTLLSICGLLKAEDRSMSPRKDADLSGPMLALARVAKEFGENFNQKRCIKELLMEKVKEDRYQELLNEIYSLIYSF
ncbi:ran GTPase-activating protein 1-like protein [Euroglyphus maynei]|uniref:Ran GTPase-activating protein 1-like protein n=1 Tax=Euroglyphus maynei TaxID=6958 RepID=A0A1Y3AQB6_EURMA|nr:ran GTPase-activating protein 1-like protein [Euroglyphus maynei]